MAPLVKIFHLPCPYGDYHENRRIDELLAADAKANQIRQPTPAKWRRKGQRQWKQKNNTVTPQFLFAVFHTYSNAELSVLDEGMFTETLPPAFGSLTFERRDRSFRLPLVREFVLWTGCIDASRAEAAALGVPDVPFCYRAEKPNRSALCTVKKTISASTQGFHQDCPPNGVSYRT
jgi:hypothetical protein